MELLQNIKVKTYIKRANINMSSVLEEFRKSNFDDYTDENNVEIDVKITDIGNQNIRIDIFYK